MRAHTLDAMIISSPYSIRYLSGFTGTSALLLVTLRGAWCLTDPRYRVQAREEVRGFRTPVVRGGFGEAIAQHSLLRGCRTAGFEEGHLTVGEFRALRSQCARTVLRPAGGSLSFLMRRKDDGELRALRRAIEITDDVFCDIVKFIRPGVTERELAAEISFRQRKEGADGDAFDVIVASGPRSAFPHARASSKKIRNGEMVVLDFGCVVDGYHSDMTRTVAVGRATKPMRDLYHVVLRAQEAGIAAVREGRAAREVDSAARERIAREGYGRYFPHSLGHGVGLRVHESPRLAPLSRDILEAGNVVTVEPGLYYPGGGLGVRLEDTCWMRPDGGVEVLAPYAMDFVLPVKR